MKIKSTRSREALTEVLQDPAASGPETAYWVFENISQGKWKNLTILTAGRYGKEFPKTYGHYHTSDQKYESSKLISGEGIFALQKKFYDATGTWVPNKVEHVYLVQASAGDETVYIPQEYAHSWTNVGTLPLLTYDDWVETGQPTHTYNEIQGLQGMAYYMLTDSTGQPVIAPNPKYTELPEPKWVTPEEFNYLTQKD
jgi:oxalate decarboxylase/phosphoglucose isomerase-like protein (cupin superfamily)